jgi:hypothetical protein
MVPLLKFTMENGLTRKPRFFPLIIILPLIILTILLTVRRVSRISSNINNDPFVESDQSENQEPRRILTKNRNYNALRNSDEEEHIIDLSPTRE